MIHVSNNKNWLEEVAEVIPSKKYLHDNNAQINFFELYNTVINIASQLNFSGVAEKDKVGILCENKKEFVELVFALWLIGAIPVPMNIRNTAAEISDSINIINIKHLYIHKELKDNFNFEANSLQNYFPIEASSAKQNLVLPSFSLKNIALILFTSGSTKKAKAVVHTFNSLFESTMLTVQFSNLSENDKWLASLPFYHIGGFMIIVRSLITGSSLFIPEGLKTKNIVSAMKLYNPTHISLIETVLQDILKNSLKPNSELKQLYLGGGPLSTKLCEKAISKGFPICKVYGSTETCSMISGLQPDKNPTKLNSVGLPLGDTQIKIADSNGNILGANQIGEIAIKSKSNFIEYYNEDEQTKSALKDGYYYSSDYGFLDSDGYLYIENRREDIVITGGENVNITEVEDAILNIPEINDAFVFGEDDETWGQIICGAIVLNIEIDSETLIKTLKKSLAGYKIPKKFYFVTEIPRSELGKVLRERLFSSLKSNEA
ncbi:MAG: o-succinylbenzoate--CoA ligase [Ignavibacteria bacterium]|nr:o-succinylbenzoate--CoA ligase [Ignavibacteria bacterium]